MESICYDYVNVDREPLVGKLCTLSPASPLTVMPVVNAEACAVDRHMRADTLLGLVHKGGVMVDLHQINPPP